MNNCLVTKLKASVNNDDLLKLGEIRIKIISDFTTGVLQFTSVTPQYCKSLTPGVLFNNGQDTIQITDSAVSVYTTGRGVISFADKYNLLSINQYSSSQELEVNIDELKYSSCEVLNFGKYSGNNIYGDVENLPNSIKTFIARNCAGLVGDISQLPISLTLFSSILCNVSGEIKDMCEAMVAAGRNTGTMQFDAPSNGLITFNGSSFSDTYYITFNSATSISIGTTSGGSEVATATYSDSAWTWVIQP